jgi:hypothetical protein
VTEFLATSLGEDFTDDHLRIVLDELVSVQSEMGVN